MAGVDDADEVGAIDGQGDGFAKFGGAEPNLLVVRERGGGDLIKPELLGVKAGAGVVRGSRRFLLEAVEEISVESIDEMDFAAAEAKNFDVVIALNVQANGIEVRQRLAILIFFPVIRIAPEKDVGAGAVVGHIEGAEDGHFLLGRVRGQNGNLVEEARESRDRSRKSNDHRVGRGCLDDNLAVTRAKRITGGRVKLGIHEGFYGVGYVFGGEGCAIRKMQARSQMEFDGATVWSDFPGSGESRFESLRLAVETNQNAASKVADGFGLAVFDEERIERFWFAMDAEMEFAAGLDRSLCIEESRRAQSNR